MSSLKYTHAIVCRIPDSFATEAQGVKGEINLELARKQHEEYRKTLRDLGLDVIELPPDENLPDGVFVDDTAVVCNGTALICRPGHPSRRKEVETIRAVIKKELELPLVEIADPKALIDGGDVLFTGKEFFVGLSQRTNEGGARALAAAFPEFPVTPVPIPSDILHLKDVMTMAGPDIICVAEGNQAQSILKRMEREATYRYHKVTVPDIRAANCLYVNGSLLHRAEFPKSIRVFEEKIDYNRIGLDWSELDKAGGRLGCAVILVRKTKYIKRL